MVVQQSAKLPLISSTLTGASMKKIVSLPSRVDFLRQMPKDSICAELGVSNGGFSQVVLNVAKPKKLHLIDCWDQPWNNGPTKYEKVSQRYCDREDVEIHRMTTKDAASTFPDQYFDWIYIDAGHQYEDILQDLLLYRDKVKDSGFVLGHDFACLSSLGKGTTGVMRAVLDVIQNGLYTMIAMSEEEYLDPQDGGIALHNIPSFALKKVLTNPAQAV